MPRKKPKRLTPLESQVMDAVWELSEATVRQVQEYLQPTRDMAYNTVLTVMRILRDKGFLESRREGRTDVYKARVPRQRMARHSLSEVRDRFFAGSAHALVSQLLELDGLSDEEIRAIRREVNKKLSESSKSRGDQQ